VGLRRVIEDGRGAGLDVEQEQAVAVLHRRIDGIGEEFAFSVEGGVVDAAEEKAVAGIEVVENRIGSRARCRTGTSSPATTATACGCARCARSRCSCRTWWAAAEQNVARRRREGGRLNVLPVFDLSCRELAPLGW